MHHRRSISAARRLRLASLLLLGNRLLIVSAIGIMLVSFFASDQQLMIYGSILVGINFLLIFAQWITASRAGCPLCRTPVLSSLGAVKHRKAKRFLGSYPLRVALAIAFKEQFRCPYCNEPTGMEVREKLCDCGSRGSETTRTSRRQ